MLVLNAKPIKWRSPPQNRFRKLLYSIATSPIFEQFILICIILNSCLLLINYYKQSAQFSLTIENINLGFTMIFLIEAIIKIIGLGSEYFKQMWNLFDLLVLILSISGTIVNELTDINVGGKTSIIRAMRICKVIRLVKRAKRLYLVFQTLAATLPGLGNICLLLFFLIYIFAFIGVQLFSKVKRNSSLTEQFNFENFPISFLTLISLATGDSSPGLMYSVMRGYGIDFQCIDQPTYDDYVSGGRQPVGCGTGYFYGVVYFYSFMILVNMIFMNLFIAVILEGFDECKTKDKRLFKPEALELFKKVWSKYDKLATGFIRLANLKDILIELGEPLGLKHNPDSKIVSQQYFIAGLELPTYNNFEAYNFYDVLNALAIQSMVKEIIEYSKCQQDGDQKELVDNEIAAKKKINLQIAKLQFDKSTNSIQVYKKLTKISLAQKIKENCSNLFTQDFQFQSGHHSAAEVVVNHLKYLVQKRKRIENLDKLKKKAVSIMIAFLTQDESPSIQQNQIEYLKQTSNYNYDFGQLCIALQEKDPSKFRQLDSSKRIASQ